MCILGQLHKDKGKEKLNFPTNLSSWRDLMFSSLKKFL